MSRVRAASAVAFFALALFFPLKSATPAYAQNAATSTAALENQIDASNAEVAQLNTEIAQYQTEIAQAGANKQTLQNAINTLNLQKQEVEAQITATQKQITATQLEIEQLGQGISTTEDSIESNQAAIEEELRSIQQSDDDPFVLQLFAPSTLGDIWNDVDANLEIQSALEGTITTLKSQKQTLASNQAASKQKQSALTSQKQTLASQQQSLTQTTQSKTELLAETNSSETTYEKLLSQAQAQLQSFSTFAENATSKGILTNQTSCDSWGCYYNQRDSQWGNDALDGTQYTMKSDGCLVTAMAMVMTHYGYGNVTPLTINDNPADFAAYYPADLLINGMPIGGATVTRVSIGVKQANIDAVLATGNPVVVGIHAYGGTHYIVFTSGSKGDYAMRDPYQPSAKDIPFTQYYSLSEIFSAAKVVITS